MIDRLRRRYEQLQGIFNASQNQPGGLLGNIPDVAILGSAIYGQGIQGKDPLEALFPAATQTAQFKKLITPKEKDSFRQLSESEKKERKLPTDKQFQINTRTKQVSQVGGSGTNINVNTTNPAEVPLKIRKQYLDESKNFVTRNDSRNAILSNTQIDFDKRTPADDFTLVYKYYKFVDPGSVVKETEFENLEKIGSAGDKIKRIIPKFTKGTTLTKNQVKNLETAMEREFPSYVKDQQKRESTYGRIFEEGGFDRDVYLQSFINMNQTQNNKTNNNTISSPRGMGKFNPKTLSDKELIERARQLGIL
jgi:hypothetical protein|tara:strand:+ start:20 stop:940 length:921 start_codon:yes stop_codon:yes gene_type:complete